MEQLDLFAARDARDAALERVAREPWMTRGLIAIERLPAMVGTGEDFRLALLERGLEAPHHHNAWGALIRQAVQRRTLCHTGAWANMQTKRSHARMTKVYRKGVIPWP